MQQRNSADSNLTKASLQTSPVIRHISAGGAGLVSKLCLTLETPWPVARQAPLSMEFSRQEFWSGLPFPSPGDLPDPGVKPASAALAGDFFMVEPPGEPHNEGYSSHSIVQMITQQLLMSESSSR